MINVANLCMGCMELKNDEAAVCASCGFREGAEPESPLHLHPRTELHGQYILGRVLGHGGFGITYLGWDLNLERKVAIKEYLPSGVAVRTGVNSEVLPFSGEMRKDFEYGLERYLDEARVVAKFQTHPSVVTVLNFFRDNGTAYLVMEYLEGTTFERYLEKQGGKTSIDTVMTVMVPVIEALGAVHAGGILHRDISPDNIYITRKWQVKVLDFGAARYALGQKSRNLSVILKEGYAPVEQYQSKGNQGPWTDVYACGATIYRALTGKFPPSALDRMQKDELEPPSQLDADITPEQELAVLKALSVQSSGRYQTMAAFRDALTGVAPASAEPSAPLPSPGGIKTAAISQAEVATIRSGAPAPAGTAPHAPPGPPVIVPPDSERPAPHSRKELKASLPKWVWAGAAALLLAIFGIGGYKQYEESRRVAEQQRQEVIRKAQFEEELRKQKAAAEEEEKRRKANEEQMAILRAQQEDIDRKARELEEEKLALERSRKQQGGKQQTSQNNQNQQQQKSNNNQTQQQQNQQQQNQQQQLTPQQQQQLRLQQQLQQQNQQQQERLRLQQQQQQQQQQVQPIPSGPTFDDSMRQSRAAMTARNYPAAMQMAQQAIKVNPGRPEGYAQAGWVALYGLGDLQTASQNYKDALARGGVVWFRVNHDHGNGSFQLRCTGDLGVARDYVEFQAQGGAHNFRMQTSTVAEARANSALRRLAGVSGDFHIKSTDGRNFNLVSVTNSKPVREMILGLMGAR